MGLMPICSNVFKRQPFVSGAIIRDDALMLECLERQLVVGGAIRADAHMFERAMHIYSSSENRPPNVES